MPPRKVKATSKSTKRDYLSHLPNELKNQICSYLGTKTIVRLLQVNRVWNCVLDSPESWKALYLRDAVDVKRVYLAQTLGRCYQCKVNGATHPTFEPNQRACRSCYMKTPMIVATQIKKLFSLTKRDLLELPGPICPPNHKRDRLYSVFHVQEATRVKIGPEDWALFKKSFKEKVDGCHYRSYHSRMRCCTSCFLQYCPE
jgi:hypothetical protein